MTSPPESDERAFLTCPCTVASGDDSEGRWKRSRTQALLLTKQQTQTRGGCHSQTGSRLRPGDRPRGSFPQPRSPRCQFMRYVWCSGVSGSALRWKVFFRPGLCGPPSRCRGTCRLRSSGTVLRLCSCAGCRCRTPAAVMTGVCGSGRAGWRMELLWDRRASGRSRLGAESPWTRMTLPSAVRGQAFQVDTRGRGDREDQFTSEGSSSFPTKVVVWKGSRQ